MKKTILILFLAAVMANASYVFTFPTFTLSETTTPSALADHGKIYTKTDNNLYFQDGAGNENLVCLRTADYGEMGNVFGSSATEAVPSADEWCAMYHANISGSAPHLNSGFSFVEGKVGSGTTTTAVAGAAINIADAAHGLLDGDYVTVQSANHVGITTVTLVDAGNFTVPISWVADEAITWQMGSYLLCATADQYRGVWTATFSQSLNNSQISTVCPFVNLSQSTKACSERLITNNTDTGPLNGSGLMDFAAGDRIWFAVKTTAAQTITFTVRNMSVK